MHDPAAMIERLARFPDALEGAAGCVSAADAGWKPGPEDWAIVEIVAHLADEETFDFRMRVRMTLDNPAAPWPQIDPEGWAEERRYIDRDCAAELARFRGERASSIEWLRTLSDPDWTRTYEHPVFGPISAGDVFVSWCAHDALHLRQVSKRLFQLAQRDGAPFATRYAGQW
jgi:hypothetical protein